MRSKLMGTMVALSLAVLLTACGNNGQDAGSSQNGAGTNNRICR
jgi:major membrane immunogen (membrane-anchored lipoprotein)